MEPFIPTIDLPAAGFCLANARTCARASADAYTGPATLVSPVDGTGVRIQELVDDGCILIAFEGSKNPRQFITDAEAWQRNIDGCAIHAGFVRTYMSLATEIRHLIASAKRQPVVITGHSLGGALAQICAYYLSAYQVPIHSVYTFGGPRVANAGGVKLYGDLAKVTYRVMNGADIVPWCPGVLAGYRHAGVPLWMPQGGRSIGHPALLAMALGNAWELYREWQRGDVALLTDHFIHGYIGQLDRLDGMDKKS